MFWYEDIYLNKDIVPTPFFEFQINGKPGKMRKVDDYTVAFEFPEPYCVLRLPARRQHGDRRRPRHARRVPELGRRLRAGALPEAVPAQVLVRGGGRTRRPRTLGFDNWVTLLRNRYSWALNPELPVLTPWKTVTPINTPTWMLERNPYYWGVDTDGNQLPYIDRITMTLAENLEVRNLRAIAGEYDIQERHMRHRASCRCSSRTSRRATTRSTSTRASTAPTSRCTSALTYEADPEIAQVAAQQGLPPRALAGHRPRPAQRDVLARRRHAGLGRAGAGHASTARARSGTRSGARSTSSRPTSCSTRSA